MGLLLVLSCAVACHTEAVSYPKWSIPLPEGTRTLDHLPVSAARRTSQRLEVANDLIVGKSQPAMLYGANSVVVDAQGNMYVYDQNNFRIQVYDASGMYVRTIGGTRGQGPEQFGDTGRLALAGDRLVVATQSRFSIWTLRGSHVADYRIPVGGNLWPFFGGPDSSVFGGHTYTSPDALRYRNLSRFGRDGDLLHRYPGVEDPSPLFVRRSTVMWNTGIPLPRPFWAPMPGGNIAFTEGPEYTVYSLGPTGDINWALRVAWERVELTDDMIDRALKTVRAHIPDAKREEVNWPSHLPALSIPERTGIAGVGRGAPLTVDGHGHLYVFPFVVDQQEHGDRPVDVYGLDGELLFSGMMPNRSWLTARGDYVYGIEVDEDTGEQVIVRYRLLESF